MSQPILQKDTAKGLKLCSEVMLNIHIGGAKYSAKAHHSILPFITANSTKKADSHKCGNPLNYLYSRY